MGRIEGRENIAAYCERSMSGLTDFGWWSRENWTLRDGPRVVSQQDQIVGTRPDCTHWTVPGLSILYYAGSGLVCYEHQMVNVAHMNATLKKMEWRPNAELKPPPRDPNRDFSLPRAWAHLEPSWAPDTGRRHDVIG